MSQPTQTQSTAVQQQTTAAEQSFISQRTLLILLAATFFAAIYVGLTLAGDKGVTFPSALKGGVGVFGLSAAGLHAMVGRK